MDGGEGDTFHRGILFVFGATMQLAEVEATAQEETAATVTPETPSAQPAATSEDPAQQKDTDIELVVSGESTVPEAHRQDLLRAAQEGLNNMLKHSGARRARG